MEILNEMDLRERTYLRTVNTLDGKDLYFRNEKTGQIEIVFVAAC